MPLQPVTGTLNLLVQTHADTQALFEEGLNIASYPSRVRRENGARDLEDYFYYLGAVHPEYLTALHHHLVDLSDEQLKTFNFTFDTWLYVLHGANDRCVDLLAARLSERPDHYTRRMMLAAITTPYALTALATFARHHGCRDEFERLGFVIPTASQPARPRFALWRRAIQVLPFPGSQADLADQPLPIGLPLDAVASDAAQQIIRWHYLSIDTMALTPLLAVPITRLHLVSPAIDTGWTLYCTFAPDGRYEVHSLKRDEDDSYFDEYTNDMPESLGYARLLPFDDQLTYCNGHVYLTDRVVGQIGGPPRGLYEAPKCFQCELVMFHILTVESTIREYGNGWRTLFTCDYCNIAACQGTGWNCSCATE